MRSSGGPSSREEVEDNKPKQGSEGDRTRTSGAIKRKKKTKGESKRSIGGDWTRTSDGSGQNFGAGLKKKP